MRAAPELRISGRRRNEIKKAVVALLRECGVNTLPVCLQKITEKKQWIPVEYAVARRSGLEIPSPSEDGCTIVREAENTREYIILYNERDPRRRIRWTLAHEIGHIALGHLELRPGDRPEKRVLEAEANYFAKNLLAPMAVIARAGAMDRETIASLCDISLEAAAYREKDCLRHKQYFKTYGYTFWDRQFLETFEFGKQNEAKK